MRRPAGLSQHSGHVPRSCSNGSPHSADPRRGFQGQERVKQWSLPPSDQWQGFTKAIANSQAQHSKNRAQTTAVRGRPSRMHCMFLYPRKTGKPKRRQWGLWITGSSDKGQPDQQGTRTTFPGSSMLTKANCSVPCARETPSEHKTHFLAEAWKAMCSLKALHSPCLQKGKHNCAQSWLSGILKA